jgi:hypothetical protein
MPIVSPALRFLLAVSVVMQPAAPLPDAPAFLAAVRANLERDQDSLAHYTYLQKRTDVRISPLGKVSTGDEKVYEVYPSLEPGGSYRRLIVVNRRRVSDAELARQDTDRQKTISEYLRRLERETPAERAKRLQREARAATEDKEAIAEVFRQFDYRLVGRDAINGEPAIVVAFTPKPGAEPRTRLGKYFRHFAGRAWVHERERQLMRLDVEATKDLTFGLGVLGRVHKGSRATFDRRRIDEGVWLPASARFTGSGRALMVRRFRVDTTTEFYNYRKFAVTTESVFDLPKPPGQP